MSSSEPLITEAVYQFQIPLINVNVHFEKLKIASLPSIDIITPEYPPIKAFLEVYRVLSKRNISVRVMLDYDPDYGFYISVETCWYPSLGIGEFDSAG